MLAKCAYHKTVEKAMSCLKVREYWQSNNVGWLVAYEGGLGGFAVVSYGL
ncbi:MAG: hypothetical protein LBE76_00350 [Nitrososphaerota archaeon]|nr:hypothetical protein [Nitrososphaerota archaeon]